MKAFSQRCGQCGFIAVLDPRLSGGFADGVLGDAVAEGIVVVGSGFASLVFPFRVARAMAWLGQQIHPSSLPCYWAEPDRLKIHAHALNFGIQDALLDLPTRGFLLASSRSQLDNFFQK